MSRQEIQELEDRASEHYLRGEYHEAREAWRAVLALEPDNEQAAEGVRLSGVFIEGTEGMPSDVPELERGAPSRKAAASAPPPVPQSAEEPGDGTLLLDPELLASLVPAPSGEPSKTTDMPASGPRLDLDRQGEGFDFGSLEELDAIPLFGDPSPAPGAAGQAAPAPNSPGPSVGTVTETQAATELHRRVQDLLAEARSLHAEGQNSEALGVLARIAILDEENGEAHELEGEVRTAMERAVLQVDGWIAEGVQAFDRGEIETARGLFERVLAVAPEHREALHYLEAMPPKGSDRLAAASADAVAPPHDPVHSDELLPDMAKRRLDERPAPRLVEDLAASSEAVPLARPVGIPAARPQIPSMGREKAPASPPPRMGKRGPRPLLLAVSIGFLAVAAVSGWWFLGGRSKDAGVAAPATPSPSRPARIATGSASTEPRQARTEPPGPGPSTRSVGEILDDARKSMASGDYAAAVVAFDQVLKRDPQSAEAKDGLTRAGEAYKAQKLEQDQVEKVKMAFAEQEFTSALHMLYRLPKTMDKGRLDGYKVNGWFNLGIVALKGGECQQARSHFDEALGIRPGDEDARRLRAFADKYLEAPKDRSFYDQVEQLAFRRVED